MDLYTIFLCILHRGGSYPHPLPLLAYSPHGAPPKFLCNIPANLPPPIDLRMQLRFCVVATVFWQRCRGRSLRLRLDMAFLSVLL